MQMVHEHRKGHYRGGAFFLRGADGGDEKNVCGKTGAV